MKPVTLTLKQGTMDTETLTVTSTTNTVEWFIGQTLKTQEVRNIIDGHNHVKVIIK
jgi:hypothetical protein